MARLRIVVKKPWDAVTPGISKGFVDDMRDRCQAVPDKYRK